MSDPDEVYSGVAALFNGDLALACPAWAPREDWLLIYLPDRIALGYCPQPRCTCGHPKFDGSGDDGWDSECEVHGRGVLEE